MLDIRLIRTNPDEVKRKLARRGQEYKIQEILELDESRRQLLVQVEELKGRKNKVQKL
jgi:seryl-tRNA synthetase